MGKVDIWMPIYIGDYLRDTEELTGPEHGAYILLLMHYWQKNGIIGSDIERLARVCRSDAETARFILGYYFTLENGNYKNKRADEEMKKAESRRASAEENGKKGGRPHKINPQETARLAKKNPPVSQTEPRNNPTPNPQKSSSSSSSSSSSKSKPEENTTSPEKADPLYQAIWQSFTAKTPTMANYAAQGKATHRLVEFVRKHADEEHAPDLARQLVTKYWELTQGRDRFWRSQPFTPMNLSAGGILDRVLLELSQAVMQEVDLDTIPF